MADTTEGVLPWQVACEFIVSHRTSELTLHGRSDAGWTVTTAEAGGVLDPASVTARIAVDEVYRQGLEDAG